MYSFHKMFIPQFFCINPNESINWPGPQLENMPWRNKHILREANVCLGGRQNILNIIK